MHIFVVGKIAAGKSTICKQIAAYRENYYNEVWHVVDLADYRKLHSSPLICAATREIEGSIWNLMSLQVITADLAEENVLIELDGTSYRFANLIQACPPDLVIHVTADNDLCKERARTRSQGDTYIYECMVIDETAAIQDKIASYADYCMDTTNKSCMEYMLVINSLINAVN
jgi:dephospho-CoA kinase